MELKEEDKKRMMEVVSKYAKLMREDKTTPTEQMFAAFLKECEFLNAYSHEGFKAMAIDENKKFKGIDPETFLPIYED